MIRDQTKTLRCDHGHDSQTLLASHDALATALALARCERDQMRLLIHDLTHEHGDGSPGAVRLYEAGVEEERRRVLGVLAHRASALRVESRDCAYPRAQNCKLIAVALDAAARAIIEKGANP